MESNLKIAIVLSAIDKVSNVIKNVADKSIKKLDDFTKKTKSLSESAKKIGEDTGKLGLLLAAPFGLALKSAADFEKSQISLRTAFQGNVREADAAFKVINKFAAQTPYELDEVLRGYIKLKNMGLDPGTKALTAYGNTASAMGKSLNDMVEAIADAATGEFERLKEFGIKASQQGNKVTFLFQGVKTTVGKNSKEIEKYLINLGNTKFAGGIEKQSKSVHGQLSTIKDSATAMASKVGTLLIPRINEVFKTIGPVIDRLVKWVEKNPQLTNTILKVVGGLSVALLTISAWSFATSAALNTVGMFTKGLRALTVVTKGALLTGLKGATAAFKTLDAATKANVIIAIITAIAMIAFLIYENWDSIKKFFINLWAKLKEIFWKAIAWVKEWGILFLGPIGFIIKYWHQIVTFFEKIWNNVKQKFNDFISFVRSIPSKMFEAGKNIVKSIWEGIKAFANKPIDAIKGIVKKIRDHLPFSPAKEGPLRDIHKIRLIETIAESMKPGPMVKAMRVTTAAAMVAASPMSAQGVPQRGGGGVTVNLNYSPTLNVNGGSPSAIADFRTELQKHSKDIYKMLQEELRKQGRTDFKK